MIQELQVVLYTEDEDGSRTTKVRLADYIAKAFSSVFKIRKVTKDCVAANREMIEVTTGESTILISLPIPVRTKTIVIFVRKVDDGSGTVKVLASDDPEDYDILAEMESYQKYISIDGNPFRKW